jgi:hypothetical protein
MENINKNCLCIDTRNAPTLFSPNYARFDSCARVTLLRRRPIRLFSASCLIVSSSPNLA